MKTKKPKKPQAKKAKKTQYLTLDPWELTRGGEGRE